MYLCRMVRTKPPFVIPGQSFQRMWGTYWQVFWQSLGVLVTTCQAQTRNTTHLNTSEKTKLVYTSLF